MALIFTGTDTNGFVVLASGNTYVTDQFARVSNDGDAFNFSTFDNTEYFVEGDIFATDDGIVSTVGASNLSVVIGEDASVNAAAGGVELLGDSTNDFGQRVTNNGAINAEFGAGINVVARTSQVTNNGTITTSNFGVFVSGDFAEVINSGVISSNSTGIGLISDNAEANNTGTINAGNDGMSVTGDGAEMFNAGTIIAASNGLEVFGDTASIDNAGEVIARFSGVFLDGDNSDFANSGSISGQIDGVATGTSTGQTARIVNTGVITDADQSGGAAIDGNLGVELVVNSGHVAGDIDLKDSDDFYDGRQGSVTGQVEGGTGSDMLLGGSEAESLSGGDDSDTLVGNDGDDSLSGGAGTDSLYGGDGDDELVGGGSRDSLRGGDGDDQLNGEGGGDTLAGGRGDDSLTGGGGSDEFVFHRNAGNDVITDFTNGTDELNVTAFGIGGFGAISGAISNNGGDAFIDWAAVGGEGFLIIEGAAGLLNGADFIF